MLLFFTCFCEVKYNLCTIIHNMIIFFLLFLFILKRFKTLSLFFHLIMSTHCVDGSCCFFIYILHPMKFKMLIPTHWGNICLSIDCWSPCNRCFHLYFFSPPPPSWMIHGPSVLDWQSIRFSVWDNFFGRILRNFFVSRFGDVSEKHKWKFNW